MRRRGVRGRVLRDHGNGEKAGIQIYEIVPKRDGSVGVTFAAHDPTDGTDFDATHDDAYPFTVTFSEYPFDPDACVAAAVAGVGPGSFQTVIGATANPKTVATAIIRYVCDSLDLGRKKGV